MVCPGCATSNPPEANFCCRCGRAIASVPEASAGPRAQAPTAPPAETGDATGGIIPYKNPAALASYYLGVFSLIPIIGLLLGPAAIVCGVLGLKAAARRPVVRGQVHAWIGILLGTAVLVGHVGLIALALR